MKITFKGTVTEVTNKTLDNGAITSNLLIKRPEMRNEFGEVIAPGKTYPCQSYSDKISEKVYLPEQWLNKRVEVEAWLDSNEVPKKDGSGNMFILNINIRKMTEVIAQTNANS